MTDATGAVTLAKAYDPYGAAVQSVGSSSTSYGFGGEQADANGLVYLRARYYSSDTGRFLTRDTWDGDENTPMSFNRWNYTNGNPVNALDPTGNFPCDLLPRDSWPQIPECRDYLPRSPCSKTYLQFVGDFDLSGYYTPIYEEQHWEGDNITAKTDPGNTSAYGQGQFLASGGGYTGKEKWALSASKGFLGHGGGICTQGTGIIQGMLIFCSTPPGVEPKFAWGTHRGNIEEGLAGLVAYNTVAMCGKSGLLSMGDTIYVDAPWYNEILGSNNPEKTLKITDTGNQTPGLCRANPPAGNEGIDLYMGEGNEAFNAWIDFNVARNASGRPYWPVYRILK